MGGGEIDWEDLVLVGFIYGRAFQHPAGIRKPGLSLHSYAWPSSLDAPKRALLD
jgi:hypothetical protein